jgi:hypothetical protein
MLKGGAVGLVESGKLPKSLTWLLNYDLTKRWRGQPIIVS